jgi:putative AdoMet-dependent methyltransferase
VSSAPSHTNCLIGPAFRLRDLANLPVFCKMGAMNERPDWQWNEVQHVGTNFADAAEVERYERRMGEFRDLAAEDAAILADLALPPGSHVLEIGTGTGHFARAAAAAGHRVTAVDISPAMLEHAEKRSRSKGLTGIEFHQGGFLTFSAPPATFDAAVSVAVLHHLPDFWKAVALQNVRRMLKLGGRFVLCDVVFPWDPVDYSRPLRAFIDAMPEGMRQPATGHVAREFSTLDWIMEGLLARAGFRIVKTVTDHAPLIKYISRGEPCD